MSIKNKLSLVQELKSQYYIGSREAKEYADELCVLKDTAEKRLKKRCLIALQKKNKKFYSSETKSSFVTSLKHLLQ